MLLVPKVYALTPAFFVLVIRAVDTLLVTKGLKPNPYLQKVLPKRTTAQVLDGDGNFNGAGQEKVAVLLLGSKTNHPMGIFAPDFAKVAGYFTEMLNELEDPNSQDNGCRFYTMPKHRVQDKLINNAQSWGTPASPEKMKETLRIRSIFPTGALSRTSTPSRIVQHIKKPGSGGTGLLPNTSILGSTTRCLRRRRGCGKGFILISSPRCWVRRLI